MLRRKSIKRTEFKRKSFLHTADPFRKIKSSRLRTSTYSTVRESGEAHASRRRLNRVGKKARAWAITRRELSTEFAAQGITSCELGYEGCWRENALGFAHGRKRRHLKG